MYCPTQLTVWPRLVVCICILLKADSVSGYKGVGVHSGKSKPYKAQVQRDGKKKTLGYFATAEEAALSIARTPEGRVSADDVDLGLNHAAASKKRKAEVIDLTD